MVGPPYNYTKLDKLPYNGTVFVYGLVEKVEFFRDQGCSFTIRDETASVKVRADRSSNSYLEGIAPGQIIRIHRGLTKTHNDVRSIGIRIGASGCHAVLWEPNILNAHQYKFITSKVCTITEKDGEQLKALNDLRNHATPLPESEMVSNGASTSAAQGRNKNFAKLSPLYKPPKRNKQAEAEVPPVVENTTPSKNTLFGVRRIFTEDAVRQGLEVGKERVSVHRGVDEEMKELFSADVGTNLFFEKFYRVDLTLLGDLGDMIALWVLQCTHCSTRLIVERKTSLFCSICAEKELQMITLKLRPFIRVPVPVKLFSGHIALVFFCLPMSHLKNPLGIDALEQNCINEAYNGDDVTFLLWRDRVFSALKGFFSSKAVCPSACLLDSVVSKQNVANISLQHSLFRNIQ
ncbi:unnamed protein product [Caenorhabditis auriculariae]|uniref:Uncharacterized protein n=1 Tax=Caenorhabditis auriculariae TaxID=2777116 RepID=A0A8S1GZY5_9PELO|nr:unnamed protein product [Caenorhabditis auriculariae]